MARVNRAFGASAARLRGRTSLRFRSVLSCYAGVPACSWPWGGIFASVKSWYPEHSCSRTEGLCGLHCSGSSRVWRLHFAMHQLLTAHKVCSEPDLLKSSVAWSKPPNSEGNLLYCLSEDDGSRFHCSVFSVPVTSADSTPVVTTDSVIRTLPIKTLTLYTFRQRFNDELHHTLHPKRKTWYRPKTASRRSHIRSSHCSLTRQSSGRKRSKAGCGTLERGTIQTRH